MDKNELRLIIVSDKQAIQQEFLSALHYSTVKEPLEQPLDDNLLTPPFFKIDTANGVQDGLNKIKSAFNEGTPYAIVFIDLNTIELPHELAIIKTIWQLDPDIQIVISSLQVHILWQNIKQLIGFNDNILVVQKPFDSFAVNQLARVLSQKWLIARNAKIHEQIKYKHIEKQTQNLKQSLCFLRSAIESSRGGMLAMDKHQSIVDYNHQLSRILDLPYKILEEKNTLQLFEFMRSHLENPDTFFERYQLLESQPDVASVDILKLKNGKVVECASNPHQLKNKTIGRIWCFHDITEQFYLQEKLVKQALHDPLTKLPNRILLEDRIQQAIAKANRDKQFFAVFFLDLDRFKLINDSLSHIAGDELLKQVASRLSHLLREEDTLARIGGDEFVIVIPNLHKEQSAMTVGQKVTACFNQPFYVQDHSLDISTSVGISLYPQDGTTVNTLLNYADLAMYSSKEAGGNQFKFYTEHLNEQTKYKAIQDEELRHAIANQEFFMVYQPLIEVATNQITSVEALLRWNHPTKGIILPLSFIPSAEESGLIIPLGEWIIDAVCKQINCWHDEGLSLIRVAINVSVQQLKQENFAETINQILKKNNILPGYLEIEVTENIIVNNSQTLNVIKKIKELGVNIVIDDFGSSNPSYNYLSQMRFDRLKIDQTFIQNIENSENYKAIVESMINMARCLDFQVLASGVETQQQNNFLYNKKCTGVQGNYLSRPLNPEDIRLLFKSLKE